MTAFDFFQANFFQEHFPWLLSVITLTQMWLSGKKYENSWLIAIGNQFLWLFWIVTTSNWGFLPMNIGILVISIRNHWLWKHPEKVRVASVKTPWIPIDNYAPFGDTCLVKNEEANVPYITKLRRGDSFPTHYKPID